MTLQVLPLAITMMAGPQILAAIILVTTTRPVRASLAFLLGVAVATSAGVAAALWLARLVAGTINLGQPSDRMATGQVIQYVLVGLLLVGALLTYLRRSTAEPPRWLRRLMAASPLRALLSGLLVILVMPSDIAVMLTVGTNLAQHGSGFLAAAPFVGMTVLIAALPLVTYVLSRERARAAMPQVRDWATANSWLINIAVYLFFVVLLMTGE